MNKPSQIILDTEERAKTIVKSIQKEIKEREKTRQKEAEERLKIPSYTAEFIKQHEKQLTPAEKGLLTKAKNKARKEYEERLAQEKLLVARQNQKVGTDGRRASSVH